MEPEPPSLAIIVAGVPCYTEPWGSIYILRVCMMNLMAQAD